jgi:hypothetical protein
VGAVSRQPVRADELARELGIDVAELLGRADDEITRVSQQNGTDAARGLTVYGGRNPVRISNALADRLRAL